MRENGPVSLRPVPEKEEEERNVKKGLTEVPGPSPWRKEVHAEKRKI